MTAPGRIPRHRTTPTSPDLVVDALSRVDLFGGLGPACLEVVAGEVSPSTVRRGQLIMREGDSGDELVLLVKGSVAIVTSSAQGDRVVVNVLRAPAHFGELALLDGAPRSATVEAMEDSDLLHLSRDAFWHLLTTQPALLGPLLRSLAAQMRRLTTFTSDWVFLDLGGRLAKALVTMADLASPDDGPCTLLIPQVRLAEMVGGSRQRVNEALAGFASRGLIVRDGRALVIQDRARLRLRAGMH